MQKRYSVTGSRQAANEATILAINAKAAIPGTNVGASAVFGSDGLFHTCLVSHVATADNEPGVGGSWTVYWSAGVHSTRPQTSSNTWTLGMSYTATVNTQDSFSAGRLYRIELASSQPASLANKFNLVRSPQGTPITVEPQPLDPDLPPSRFTGASQYTVDPPYITGSPLMTFSLNQRGTFSWDITPRYGFEMSGNDLTKDALRLVFAAGTTVSGSATYQATLFFEE